MPRVPSQSMALAPAWAPVASASVAGAASYAAFRWRSAMPDLDTQLVVLLLVWSSFSLARSIFGPMRRCSDYWLIQYGAMAAYYLQSPLVVCAVSIVQYSSDSNLKHVAFCVALLLLDFTLLPLISTMSTYSPGDSPVSVWLSIKTLYYMFCLWSVAIKLTEYESRFANTYGVIVPGAILCAVLPVLFSYVTSDCYLRNFWRPYGKGRIATEPHQPQDSSFIDTVLSYSSFKSLATQYFQLPCADESEADQQLCHYFRELLEYNGIFTIVERQLAILHDYLFDTYRSIYGSSVFNLMWLYPYINLDSSLLGLRSFEWCVVTTAAVGFMVKEKCLYAIIFLCIVHQVIACLQCQLLLRSDTFILMAASVNQSIHCRPMETSFRLPYWQNKLGQYSIVKDSHRHSSKKAFIVACFKAVVFSDWDLIFIKHHPVADDPVMVPDSVRKFVAQALPRLIGSPPANGIRSPSWRTQRKYLHISILVSHVATCYCDDQPPAAPNTTSQFEAYEVATVLSRYCAYLVAFLPDFLAEDNRHATRKALQDILQEAQVKIQLVGRGRMSMEEKRELNPAEDEVSLSTFDKGFRLGKKLKELEQPSVLWNEIAEFWAEMIIFIATSENLAPHVERLAKGGEFVTHVWAFLCNASVCDQVTEPRTLQQRLHDMATGSNTRREEPRQDTPQPGPDASASVIGRDI